MIQKLRVPLGFVVAAGVLYLAVPTGLSILAGLPIALLGGVLRGLAAGVVRKDAALATSGVYAWTRNPLYFGSFLLTLGFAVMSASVLAVVLAVFVSLVIYPRVIRNEESHLAQLFPVEFRDYSSRVPRFWPRFRRDESSFSFTFSFSRYLANREYNTFLGFAAVFGVFVAKWRLL